MGVGVFQTPMDSGEDVETLGPAIVCFNKEGNEQERKKEIEE